MRTMRRSIVGQSEGKGAAEKKLRLLEAAELNQHRVDLADKLLDADDRKPMSELGFYLIASTNHAIIGNIDADWRVDFYSNRFGDQVLHFKQNGKVAIYITQNATRIFLHDTEMHFLNILSVNELVNRQEPNPVDAVIDLITYQDALAFFRKILAFIGPVSNRDCYESSREVRRRVSRCHDYDDPEYFNRITASSWVPYLIDPEPKWLPFRQSFPLVPSVEVLARQWTRGLNEGGFCHIHEAPSQAHDDPTAIDVFFRKNDLAITRLIWRAVDGGARILLEMVTPHFERPYHAPHGLLGTVGPSAELPKDVSVLSFHKEMEWEEAADQFILLDDAIRMQFISSQRHHLPGVPKVGGDDLYPTYCFVLGASKNIPSLTLSLIMLPRGMLFRERGVRMFTTVGALGDKNVADVTGMKGRVCDLLAVTTESPRLGEPPIPNSRWLRVVELGHDPTKTTEQKPFTILNSTVHWVLAVSCEAAFSDEIAGNDYQDIVTSMNVTIFGQAAPWKNLEAPVNFPSLFKNATVTVTGDTQGNRSLHIEPRAEIKERPEARRDFNFVYDLDPGRCRLVPEIQNVHVMYMDYKEGIRASKILTLQFESQVKAVMILRAIKGYIGTPEFGHVFTHKKDETTTWLARQTWRTFSNPQIPVDHHFMEFRIRAVHLKVDKLVELINHSIIQPSQEDIPAAIERFWRMNDEDILFAHKANDLESMGRSILFEEPFNRPHLYFRGYVNTELAWLKYPAERINPELTKENLKQLVTKLKVDFIGTPTPLLRTNPDVTPLWAVVFKTKIKGRRRRIELQPVIVMVPLTWAKKQVVTIFRSAMHELSPAVQGAGVTWMAREVTVALTEVEYEGEIKSRWTRLIDTSDWKWASAEYALLMLE